MKKILLTLLITITLCLLLKAVLPINNTEGVVNTYWVTKTHTNKKFDIVICGDSRIYRGISTQDLTKNLNIKLNAINLGYSSAGYSDEYLDFALSKFEPNSKHKILILGITPHSLTKEAFENEHYHSLKELNKTDVYKALHIAPILNFFEPYKASELINQEHRNYQMHYVTNSWVPSFYLQPDSTHALKSYKKTFSAYQVRQAEISSFLNKIKHIELQGIKILAFRPPNTVQMRQLENSLSDFDEELLRNRLGETSVEWLDFKDVDYRSYDGSHLHFESGKKISEEIGEKINEFFLSKNTP